MPRSYNLLAVSVVAQANKIAHAKIVFQDGEASTGSFPIISEGLFEFGRQLEIKAGDSEQNTTLFSGVIVGQQVKVNERKSPQLVITCKHQAVKMTLHKQGRYFESLSDKDVIEEVFSQHGIQTEIDILEEFYHEQLIQYDETDWDYCLSRLTASGLVLFTQGDKLVIKPPAVNDQPKLTLEYGATLLSADLSTDARSQKSPIEAMKWESENQAIAFRTGRNEFGEQPGNYSTSTLADSLGGDMSYIRKPATSDSELQQLASAHTTYNAVNRVSGTLKTIGVSDVMPGDIVNLMGLSQAFNGHSLVTGIRHELDTVSGWRTYFQVGGIELPEDTSNQISSGLQIGKVVDIEDPENEYRVKVKLPMLDETTDGIWVRIASLDAGPDRGFFVRPEIDDEVVLSFLQNDSRQGVILGMLHSSAHPATESPQPENNIKTWVTRSGQSITFDEEKVAISLATPNGNKLDISEDESGILLTDENGNSYGMTPSGIEINSASDLSINADGNVMIKAGINLTMESASNLQVKGAMTTVESGAVTTIKGSLVKIN
ncbi:type VI secretion system tip protein VgrG [Glaciecola sp. 1036]|uniref:type VI secretion system tip protein VgrG n=1 Tax=Alteromonadaceae TaxID=72275 RepID=UPI003D07B24D